MRVCQHCRHWYDIVKSKVVISKPGWRLESAELISPLLAEADILFLAGKPARVYTGQQAEV